MSDPFRQLFFKIVIGYKAFSAIMEKPVDMFRQQGEGFMLGQFFTEFGLSASDTNIYLYLLESGGKQASAIARQLGMARATMYGHLEKLKQAGFITEFSRGGTREFTAETPDKLNLLYKQKLDRMQNAQKQFENTIPELHARAGTKNRVPRLQYFETLHGLQHMMSDILLCRDIKVYSFWPPKSMIELMTPDYLTYFNLVRIERNISLQAIWPQAQAIDIRKYPFMGSGKEFLREARIAPAKLDARLSYMVYEDKVMVTSSQQEKFGFILQSRDMAEMLIDQFLMIWSLSAPVTHSAREGKRFLDELEKGSDA